MSPNLSPHLEAVGSPKQSFGDGLEMLYDHMVTYDLGC